MATEIQNLPDRRPVGMRNAQWIIGLAKFLQARGLKPNTVSIASVVFSALAGFSFLATRWTPAPIQILLFIAVAILIAIRGLCNLADGLIAVEGGLKSPAGGVFNDLPDRISDLIVCVCAGYAISGNAWGPPLGWAAGSMAILTAYVRVLGSSSGASHFFIGPMAKTHRMSVLVVGALASAIEKPIYGTTWCLTLALVLIVIGCIVTSIRRTRRILQELGSR